MNFNEHLELQGSHAFFSASQFSWLNYSPEKALEKFKARDRVALGTEIHEYASVKIDLGQKVTSMKSLHDDICQHLYHKFCMDKSKQGLYKYGLRLIKHLGELPKEVFETVKLYINDAIGYRMTTEQKLKHSELFFGTTDAIVFKNNFLRIHDLKTGATPAHIEQLLIYAAFFCLEYDIRPSDIDMELRLYQNGEVLCHTPQVDEIVPIIDHILTIEKMIENEKDGE